MLIKKSVILIMALLLSACGYHLRGALQLPAGLKNVYLEGGSAELRGQFKRAMEISSVPFASSPETAGMIVKIFNEDSQRRVLSLNSGVQLTILNWAIVLILKLLIPKIRYYRRGSLSRLNVNIIMISWPLLLKITKN